jgi:hypothetical protein
MSSELLISPLASFLWCHKKKYIEQQLNIWNLHPFSGTTMKDQLANTPTVAVADHIMACSKMGAFTALQFESS